jgi:hypothetical protein
MSLVAINLDRFGIAKLFSGSDDSRQWYAAWDDGHERSIDSGDPDPYDATFHVHGTGRVAIDGHGIARMSGQSPRMYVYDDIGDALWKNVEVTFYAMRLREVQQTSSQGFVCGARSEHQAAGVDPCNAHTYYGRLLYDGRAHFAKEVKHRYDPPELWYAENRPNDSNRIDWQTEEGRMPTLHWIGMKYVVRNINGDSGVRLSLFMDLSAGANGGAWQKIAEIEDMGDWRRADVTDCNFDADQVWRHAAASVFLRNDYLEAADYTRFSIREVLPT